jgi:gluconate 2-dehydrogenase gamma chain
LGLRSTRRSFLEGAAASFGLLLISSLTPDLVARAEAYIAGGKPLRFLTPQQAADFEAFSAQIIPTDATPGAREAGAVYFVDYVLAEINPEQQADFRTAMSALASQAVETVPGAKSFSSLISEQQIAAMKAMESATSAKPDANAPAPATMPRAAAFAILRASVLLGTFSDPALGGNREKIGWKLINFDDQAYWAPPFGYYDASTPTSANAGLVRRPGQAAGKKA